MERLTKGRRAGSDFRRCRPAAEVGGERGSRQHPRELLALVVRCAQLLLTLRRDELHGPGHARPLEVPLVRHRLIDASAAGAVWTATTNGSVVDVSIAPAYVPETYFVSASGCTTPGLCSGPGAEASLWTVSFSA